MHIACQVLWSHAKKPHAKTHQKAAHSTLIPVGNHHTGCESTGEAIGHDRQNACQQQFWVNVARRAGRKQHGPASQPPGLVGARSGRHKGWGTLVTKQV